MKICYISNSAAPSKNASSLQTSKLCEGLTKQGNNVLLILPNTGDTKKIISIFITLNQDLRLLELNFLKNFLQELTIIYIASYLFLNQISVNKIYISLGIFLLLYFCVYLKKTHLRSS